jgi:putative RecB family exonuclease
MDSEKLQLSPSRISDFQQCPQLYKYRAIDKLPERPGVDALRGSLVHLVLEKLFDLNSSDRTFDKAVSIISDCWKELLSAEPELVCALDSNIAFPLIQESTISDEVLNKLFQESANLIANYFQLEDPQRIEPKSREELISFDLNDELIIKGYVDRIDISESGWVRVNDYKTGNSPKENFSGKAMFQLKFYALIIFKQMATIPKQLRLIYLKNSQILSYEPDLKELEITEAKVLTLASQINDAKKTNIWPTQVSKLCNYCYFKNICPEYN